MVKTKKGILLNKGRKEGTL